MVTRSKSLQLCRRSRQFHTQLYNALPTFVANQLDDNDHHLNDHQQPPVQRKSNRRDTSDAAAAAVSEAAANSSTQMRQAEALASSTPITNLRLTCLTFLLLILASLAASLVLSDAAVDVAAAAAAATPSSPERHHLDHLMRQRKPLGSLAHQTENDQHYMQLLIAHLSQQELHKAQRHQQSLQHQDQLHSQQHYLQHQPQHPQQLLQFQQQDAPKQYSSTLEHLAQVNNQQQQQHINQQPSQSLWTNDLAASASNNQVEQLNGGGEAGAQYISYRPLSSVVQQQQQQQNPTTPSINRQLMAPPPFYDLGLAQVTTVQMEPQTADRELHSARAYGARSLLSGRDQQTTVNQHAGNVGAGSQRSAVVASARSNGARQLASEPDQDANHHQLTSSGSATAETGDASHSNGAKVNSQVEESNNNAAKNSAQVTNNSNESQQQASNENNMMVVDKTIEPRQKRRIFNRILKKAEWNHLFVELSKVFLRYFLDLALKDIIGKQNGGETTTSRKKLDAQSELTDLLKDFVKTAISNI